MDLFTRNALTTPPIPKIGLNQGGFKQMTSLKPIHASTAGTGAALFVEVAFHLESDGTHQTRLAEVRLGP